MFQRLSPAYYQPPPPYTIDGDWVWFCRPARWGNNLQDRCTGLFSIDVALFNVVALYSALTGLPPTICSETLLKAYDAYESAMKEARLLSAGIALRDRDIACVSGRMIVHVTPQQLLEFNLSRVYEK